MAEVLYTVADIQLAFDNDGMMTWLSKRGDALKSLNFAKVK